MWSFKVYFSFQLHAVFTIYNGQRCHVISLTFTPEFIVFPF